MFFSDSKPTPHLRRTAARVPMGTAAPGDIGRCGVGAAVVAGGAKGCDGGGAEDDDDVKDARELAHDRRRTPHGRGGGVFPGGGIQNPREVESILPYRRHKMGGDALVCVCVCVHLPPAACTHSRKNI